MAMVNRKLGLEKETEPLIDFLAEMNWKGFWTCSSQPSHNGMHPYQRAYVAGYMPPAMKDFLIMNLPADIVVWTGQDDSRQVAAMDSDLRPVGYTWSGAMTSPWHMAMLQPFEDQVVAFHAIDKEWNREEPYLFEHVVQCIKDYWQADSEARIKAANPARSDE
jgi:hypothetical protein